MRHSYSNSLAPELMNIRALASRWHPQLAYSVRSVVAAVAALALARALKLPLSLWAALTAIIVSQMSVGRSLRATVDYFVGTIGGAIYGAAISIFVPHTSEITTLGALALTLAPLVVIAAFNSSFAVAPITGVLVLLIPTITHVSTLQSALFRVAEVATGGVTAVLISLVVLPTRANALMIDAAAEIVDLMAHALRDLMVGFTRPVDPDAILCLQNPIDEGLARLGPIATEAGYERVTWLDPYGDPAPLHRTLLRLREDLVMIGRSAVAPLPEPLKARLSPRLGHVAETADHVLRDSAAALRARRAPPALDTAINAFEAYSAEIDALRSDGLLRELPTDGLERIFALGFSLEQLQRNFSDLVRCISEWAQPRLT
jgi:uncharacterized membrane protein YccC